MNVLPASMPSADLRMMVMVGPWLITRWTAIPIATSAARSGMIQTIEMRRRFFRISVACGRWSRSVSSAMAYRVRMGGVPDQARIEGLGGEHRQHHDGGEEQHAGTGGHRHQRLQLHQRDGERIDEHIEHRPAADELDHAIEPRA